MHILPWVYLLTNRRTVRAHWVLIASRRTDGSAHTGCASAIFYLRGMAVRATTVLTVQRARGKVWRC